MSATKYNITLEAGATYSLTVTLKDSAGTPVDISGWTARMKVRPAYGRNAYVSLTSSSGLTLGGGAGTIAIAITATQTASMGSGVYDLEVIKPDTTTVYRILEGEVSVRPEVSGA